MTDFFSSPSLSGMSGNFVSIVIHVIKGKFYFFCEIWEFIYFIGKGHGIYKMLLKMGLNCCFNFFNLSNNFFNFISRFMIKQCYSCSRTCCVSLSLIHI